MSEEIQTSGKHPAEPKKKSALRTGLEWILKAAVLRGLGKLFDLLF